MIGGFRGEVPRQQVRGHRQVVLRVGGDLETPLVLGFDAVLLHTEIQVAGAVLERLAEFSTEGETGSMTTACWKTKNRGKVT